MPFVNYHKRKEAQASKVPFSFPKLGDEKWYSQKIDHFDSTSTETYQQRYYINSNYADHNSTASSLIFYIGGESTLEEGSVQKLQVVNLANKTGSIIFGLEHRFFGKSMPFETLSVEHLKLLTIEQGLADLAQFITEMKGKYCYNHTNCPVVVVGGSYPGALSSWFKLLYPHLADASWASSAPVEIKSDFQEYDEHCAAFIENISPQCRERLYKTFQLIDNELTGSEDRNKKVKKLFNVDVEKYNMTDISFLYVLADILAGPVQYADTDNQMKNLCSRIDHANEAEYINILAKSFEKMIGDDKIEELDLLWPTDENSSADSANTRSWTWMTCNQVGWFQTASGRLRHEKIKLTYFEDVCHKLFGVGTPNDQQMNARFGGRTPASTSVFFVNGAADPWSEMSVLEPNKGLDRMALTIPGTHHCDDLRSPKENDSPELSEARIEILSKIERWAELASGEGCGHGRRVLGRCACDGEHWGDRCDKAVHSQASFRAITVMSVVVPTALLLIIGAAVWMCGKKEDSDFGARPALYT